MTCASSASAMYVYMDDAIAVHLSPCPRPHSPKAAWEASWHDFPTNWDTRVYTDASNRYCALLSRG